MMYLDLQHCISSVARDMNLNNQNALRILQTLSANPQIKDPDLFKV